MTTIDVLAVMDDARNVLTSLGSPGTANGVAEARAAVAELLGAAEPFREMFHAFTREETERLRAALARVQGGEA